MGEEEKKYKIIAHSHEKIPLKEKYSIKEFGFTVEKTYNKEPEWEVEEGKLYNHIENMVKEIKQKIKQENMEEK